jgi:hypothetical protein
VHYAYVQLPSFEYMRDVVGFNKYYEMEARYAYVEEVDSWTHSDRLWTEFGHARMLFG